jgi:hypothetical protein
LLALFRRSRAAQNYSFEFDRSLFQYFSARSSVMPSCSPTLAMRNAPFVTTPRLTIHLKVFAVAVNRTKNRMRDERAKSDRV